MHPVLFTIPLFGGLKLHTYGLMVAIAFLVGIAWVGHEAKRVGEPPEKLTDLCFYIVVAAIVGSRLFYVIEEEPGFWRHPLDFFKIWEGGLVFYGGLIGAVAVSIWYMRRHRLNFWKVADIFMPGVALGHVFGRLGCFSAGCCYGRPAPAGFPMAVTFPPDPNGLAPAGVPLYPSQLFESAAELVIFLILLSFRKKKKFDGQVMLLYLILYSISRTILEFYRGDLERGFLFGHTLSVAQFVSLLIALAAMILWAVRLRKAKASAKI
jgi:phosphatidylglycerol---prolipoprotein diacylglyceryl transferase